MSLSTPASSKPDSPLPKSREAFVRANAVIPGGVNSPARAFRAVGSEPPLVAKTEEAHLFDINGHRYIEYIGSRGPMILGHAYPRSKTAVLQALVGSAAGGCGTTDIPPRRIFPSGGAHVQSGV